MIVEIGWWYRGRNVCGGSGYGDGDYGVGKDGYYNVVVAGSGDDDSVMVAFVVMTVVPVV